MRLEIFWHNCKRQNNMNDCVTRVVYLVYCQYQVIKPGSELFTFSLLLMTIQLALWHLLSSEVVIRWRKNIEISRKIVPSSDIYQPILCNVLYSMDWILYMVFFIKYSMHLVLFIFICILFNALYCKHIVPIIFSRSVFVEDEDIFHS